MYTNVAGVRKGSWDPWNNLAMTSLDFLSIPHISEPWSVIPETLMGTVRRKKKKRAPPPNSSKDAERQMKIDTVTLANNLAGLFFF